MSTTAADSQSAREPWIGVGLLGAGLALGLLFVHVPASLWAGNIAEFQSGVWPLLGLGCAALAVGLVLVATTLWILPYRLRPAAASGLCAIGVVCWAYAYFVPGRMGVLNGQQSPMDFRTSIGSWELMLVGLAGVAIAAVVLLRPRLARLVLLLLNVGLGVATIGTVVGAIAVAPKASGAADPGRVFRFSPRQNVLIILLDALQSDVVSGIFQRDAAVRAAFDGFDFYKDTLGVAPTTFLSLPAIHSGEVFEPGADTARYFADSIEHRSFLTRFAAAGYDAALINPVLGICPDRVTNCLDASVLRHTADARLLREGLRLLDLSLFRVSPIWLKRRIYGNGAWLAVRLVDGPFEINRIFEGNAFLTELGQRLVVSDGPPTIKFLHLFSTHPPFVLNDECQAVSMEHAPERFPAQARCALLAVSSLFDRMKKAGIYDDTLILVFADHGMGLPSGYVEAPTQSPADWVELAGAANPTFLLKPRGRRGPMQEANAPVQLTDVGATLCALSQACTTPQGAIVGQAPANRRRPFNFYAWKAEYWDSWSIPTIVSYDVGDLAWKRESWWRTGDAAAYRLGDAITFGRSGTSEGYLRSGWAGAEEGGRWTDGRIAQLALHITDPGAGPLELIARISAFMPPTLASQTVTWRANDQVVGTWTFTNSALTERRVQIPRAVLGRSQDLRLAIYVESPQSPRDLGIADDPRHLGLVFGDLKIIGQPQPASDALTTGGR